MAAPGDAVVSVFGPLTIAFAGTSEFALPPELLQEGGEGSGVISNVPLTGGSSDTLLDALGPRTAWSVASVPAPATRYTFRVKSDPAAAVADAATDAESDSAAAPAQLLRTMVAHDDPALSFLKQGVSPSEMLTAATPNKLLFALGELHSKYGLGAEARLAVVSEAFVQLLAWQRVTQLLAVGPPRKKEKTEPAPLPLDAAVSMAQEPSSDPYATTDLPKACVAFAEVEVERRIALLTTLADLVDPDAGNTVRIASRGIQTHLSTPGVNTTSPYCGKGLSTATAVGVPNWLGKTCALSSRAPSPVLLRCWSIKRGLFRGSSVTDGTLLEVRLPVGVTSLGAVATDEVQVGVAGISLYPKTLCPLQLRLVVRAAAPGGAVSVSVVNCGGGSGVRVKGRRWSMSEVLPLCPGQVVRFGADMALACALVKE